MLFVARFLVFSQFLGCLLGPVPKSIALEISPLSSEEFTVGFEGILGLIFVKAFFGWFQAQSSLVRFSQPIGHCPGVPSGRYVLKMCSLPFLLGMSCFFAICCFLSERLLPILLPLLLPQLYLIILIEKLIIL